MATGCIARISAARRALAEAKTLDDVRRIRDEAEAVRQLLKARGESRVAQNDAASVKIRAERLLGETLAAMEGHGTHGGKRRSSSTVKLENIAVTKTQSHRWQTMAKVSEEQLVAIEAKANENDEELTSREVYKLGRAASGTKPIVHAERIEGVTDDLSSLSGMRFGTVYADPPWRYDNKATRSNVEAEYSGTMTVEQICEMPVADLCLKNAHLHLWTTTSFLPLAFKVIEAWGFEYRSELIWIKPQLGIGNYWRVSHEVLLLGVRGNAKSFAEHCHPSWLSHDRLKHSEKPQRFRELVERVSPGPYLELFGRKQVAGWYVFGNQVELEDRRMFA